MALNIGLAEMTAVMGTRLALGAISQRLRHAPNWPQAVAKALFSNASSKNKTAPPSYQTDGAVFRWAQL